MLIKPRVQHTIAMLVFMAVEYQDETKYTKAADIAKAIGLTNSYAEQLIHGIKLSNIFCAMRGPGGGYRLSKNPYEITMFSVLSFLCDYKAINKYAEPFIDKFSMTLSSMTLGGLASNVKTNIV